MSSDFCLTVRFLDPVPSFHGRGDGDEPEWPPSPLRLFQALVAASAARWRGRHFVDSAQPALKWIETRAPVIVAPESQANRTLYRMYVPNNAADLVTSAWARGNSDASIAEHRVEKDVRPTRLVGGDCVHYLWDVPEPVPVGVSGYLETLATSARSITHLGWGVDMVAANANVLSAEDAAKLPGHVWRPVPVGGTSLRVPIPGTLAALIHRHGRFLIRLASEAFQPVPPLSAFRIIGYRRVTDPAAHPFVAFKFLNPEYDRFAWFSATSANAVAARTRHATADAAKHEPKEWVDSYVHGHRAEGADTKPRFSYLPLPTIERRSERAHVIGGICRVLLAELVQASESRLLWARQLLPGQFLIDEKSGQKRAMLIPLNDSDWVLRQYAGASDTWATVTPVVLPGSDEGKSAKAEKLFFKTLRHTGYCPDALAELDFRNVSFWPGGDLALRFQRPDYLKKDRWSVYHVRLRWKQSIKGPLAIGAGRHCGLGIFAAMSK